MDGMLELAVVRSPYPHALIKSIDTTEAQMTPGVVGIITAKDIKGSNRLKDDQPLLCDKKIHVLGDAVAIVAAESKTQALAGVEAVKVEYEILHPVMTTEEALAQDSPQVHEGSLNLCYEHPQIKGDAEAAMNRASARVEAEFSTQLIHQAALEPEASVAYMEPDEEDNAEAGRNRTQYLHSPSSDGFTRGVGLEQHTL